ncbi:unnamed protein product, partial [Iphiclides podalirius]
MQAFVASTSGESHARSPPPVSSHIEYCPLRHLPYGVVRPTKQRRRRAVATLRSISNRSVPDSFLTPFTRVLPRGCIRNCSLCFGGVEHAALLATWKPVADNGAVISAFGRDKRAHASAANMRCMFPLSVAQLHASSPDY